MPNDTETDQEDFFDNMRRSNEARLTFPDVTDETQDVREPMTLRARRSSSVSTRKTNCSTAAPMLRAYSRRQTPPRPVRAMKQVAETGREPEQQIPSMGCSIKWKDGAIPPTEQRRD